MKLIQCNAMKYFYEATDHFSELLLQILDECCGSLCRLQNYLELQCKRVAMDQWLTCFVFFCVLPFHKLFNIKEAIWKHSSRSFSHLPLSLAGEAATSLTYLHRFSRPYCSARSLTWSCSLSPSAHWAQESSYSVTNILLSSFTGWLPDSEPTLIAANHYGVVWIPLRSSREWGMPQGLRRNLKHDILHVLLWKNCHVQVKNTFWTQQLTYKKKKKEVGGSAGFKNTQISPERPNL